LSFKNNLCPICGSEITIPVWFYLQYMIAKCSDCDVEFSLPFIGGDISYYSSHETYRDLESQIKKDGIPIGNIAIAKEIDHVFRSYFKKNNNQICVLDYGCGSGWCCSQLMQKGYDVIGVDFNPEMIRVSKKIFGVNAFLEQEKDSWKIRKFDAIIINHVLEHVSNPVELLSKLRDSLSINGIVFISVPNRDFIRARKKLRLGQLPAANYPPHHITFWSVRSLNHVLSASGYKVLRCFEQAYPEEIQMTKSLREKFKRWAGLVPCKQFAAFSACMGNVLKISGVNLFAVGQPKWLR